MKRHLSSHSKRFLRAEAERLHNDCYPPVDWTDQQIAEKHAAIIALIEGANDRATPISPWLGLVRQLPDGLRKALLDELKAGNGLCQVNLADWPNEGSIVVNMRNRFSVARHAPPPGVRWDDINDIHFWMEQLSQKVDFVEHLIIA